MDSESNFPCDVELFTANDVDFTRKSYFRQFRIKVDEIIFYVNPHVLSQASPVFESMLMDSRFMERTKSLVTLIDETVGDIHLLLKSICPTYYALYPYPVNEKTFPTLARLADKFLISGLRNSCEQFVIQPNLLHYSTDSLIRMFDSVHHSGYSEDIQQQLLLAILRKSSAQLYALNSISNSPTYKMIINTVKQHTITKEEVQGIWCEMCKYVSCREPNMQSCSSCKRQLCRKCSTMPCPVILQQHINSIDSFS